MKKILLIPNINKDPDLAVTRRVAALLIAEGAECFLDERYVSDIQEGVTVCTVPPEGVELIVVIGGDGSVIDASVLAVEKDIAVIGINLGNLGYLAEVEVDELNSLKKLFTGEYRIEEKLLLSVEKSAGGARKASDRFAVNDIIISHDSFLGIAEFSLTNTSGESIKYRADGLIISTPAGSTAYSLSAGGPIIAHDIDAMIATPICPHSFFNRSIVFNCSEELKLCNNGRSSLKISVDGRLFDEILPTEECIVKASPRRLRMLTFSESNMFSTLFGKMRRFENI